MVVFFSVTSLSTVCSFLSGRTSSDSPLLLEGEDGFLVNVEDLATAPAFFSGDDPQEAAVGRFFSFRGLRMGWGESPAKKNWMSCFFNLAVPFGVWY